MNLSRKEVEEAFADPTWNAKFPPILSVAQVAELLQIPKLTIYDWHSRGLLDGCCRKVGKYLRFFRSRVILTIFNQKE